MPQPVYTGYKSFTVSFLRNGEADDREFATQREARDFIADSVESEDDDKISDVDLIGWTENGEGIGFDLI